MDETDDTFLNPLPGVVDDTGGSSGGLWDTVGGWFGDALKVYGQIETAKIQRNGWFSYPYSPVTYGQNPNASVWDIRGINGTFQRPAVMSSGMVMIGAGLLIGLTVYLLAKK